METVCIISSRQVGFVPISRWRDDRYEFVLIISEEERYSLSNATLEAFSAVRVVRSTGCDGVLWGYDLEEVLTVIARLDRHPVALITFDEGQTLLVAQLRELLSIDGATVAETEPYRNKLLMKKYVKKAGLKVPDAEHLPGTDEWPTYAELVERLGTKLVVKPVSSAGTNAVDVVRNEEEFERKRANCARGQMKFEVEEYIPGHLFHCDTIWAGNELRFAACTKYVNHTIDFQHGAPLGGRVMSPDSPPAREISDFCIRAVRALGLRGVAQHTEIIVGPGNDITFVESGARPPGMLVAQMYEKAFGRNIVDETLMSHLPSGQAEKSRPSPLKLDCEAFYLVYPKAVGIVCGFNKIPVRRHVNVAEEIRPEIGDRHSGCHSNLDLVGTVLAWGSTDQIDEFYEKMKKYRPVSYRR